MIVSEFHSYIWELIREHGYKTSACDDKLGGLNRPRLKLLHPSVLGEQKVKGELQVFQHFSITSDITYSMLLKTASRERALIFN